MKKCIYIFITMVILSGCSLFRGEQCYKALMGMQEYIMVNHCTGYEYYRIPVMKQMDEKL